MHKVLGNCKVPGHSPQSSNSNENQVEQTSRNLDPSQGPSQFIDPEVRKEEERQEGENVTRV